MSYGNIVINISGVPISGEIDIGENLILGETTVITSDFNIQNINEINANSADLTSAVISSLNVTNLSLPFYNYRIPYSNNGVLTQSSATFDPATGLLGAAKLFGESLLVLGKINSIQLRCDDIADDEERKFIRYATAWPSGTSYTSQIPYINASGLLAHSSAFTWNNSLAKLSASNFETTTIAASSITCSTLDTSSIETSTLLTTSLTTSGITTTTFKESRTNTETYILHTDPGDTTRRVLIENSTTSTADNLFCGLSFCISPSYSYFDGRCNGDFRFLRDGLAGYFMLSANNSDSFYKDIAKFSSSGSRIYAPLTVEGVFTSSNSTESTEIGIGSVILSGGVSIAKNTHINGQLVIVNSTNSSSTSTGCARFVGGIGMNGSCYIGGQLNVQSVTDSSSVSTGCAVFSGGLGIAKKLYVGTDCVVSGTLTAVTALGVSNLSVTNTAQSASVTTGCATFSGGIGIAKTVFADKLNIINTTEVTSPTAGGCALFAGGVGINKQLRVNGTGFFSNGCDISNAVYIHGDDIDLLTSQNWKISASVSNWHNWRFSVPAGNNPRVYFANASGTVNANVYAGSFTPFSGCHIARNVGRALNSNDIGKLFMLDGSLYQQTEILQAYVNGKICDVNMSKAIYGVLVDCNYIDQNGEFHDDVQLLSVGEGGLLIHDDSGFVSIECGDLIGSRSDGYGRKIEDSEFTPTIYKYVVARARETYSGPSPYLLAVTLECA